MQYIGYYMKQLPSSIQNLELYLEYNLLGINEDNFKNLK